MGNKIVRCGELVTLEKGSEYIDLEANNITKLLVLAGEPLNKPVVGYSPFVMNSREEIVQTISDVQSGKFGQITKNN